MVRTILALSLFLLGSAASVPAQDTHPAAHSTPAFDQIKSLAGEWEGKNESGSPTKIYYTVISNGSVVMEHLGPSTPHEMVTMYSLDGDRILVTHYCAAGNQPVMETGPSPAANGKYDFSFVRVTGTKTPDEPHMSALVLSIPDKDHLTQTWTFDNHGKPLTDTFTYTRVK
jgi:hypothetical protein